MFAYPAVLLLLILIPFSLVFFIVRSVARATAMQRIGDAELIQTLLAQVSPSRRRWKAFLWTLTLTMVILALARPLWGIQTEVVQTEGVQVVLTLDVSRSMNAEDLAPNRLEQMKFDMLDLVDQLTGHDVGIVLFAGHSFVYMPLTYDMGAARIFISDLSTDMTSVQGTNVTAAIESAISLFDTRSNAQRLIILASDGENHEVDPANIANFAAENNIIIHTIGYGTIEGALVPLYDQFGNFYSYKSDRNDELVTSKLNDETLKRIAEVTGGIYQQAGPGDTASILIESINQLESGELREELITRPVERFGIFVVLALFALSIEILLPETRGNKR